MFCAPNAVLAEDLDLDMSPAAEYTVIFVDSSGQEINSADEYGKIVFNGNKKLGETVSVDLEYGDGTAAYEFLGWYDGETFVSKDLPFTHKYGRYKNFYAKVLSHNVLSEGASFESITESKPLNVSTWKTDYYSKDGETYSQKYTGDAPTGHSWGGYYNTYPTHQKIGDEYVPLENIFESGYCNDPYFKVQSLVGDYEHTYYSDYDNDKTATATVTVKPHSGNTMIGIYSYWRHNIKELKGFKKNTDYVLSFWVYTQNDVSLLSWAAVADTYHGVKTGSTEAHIDGCELLGATGITGDFGKWTQIKIPFNSGDNEVLYFHIGNNRSKISKGTQGMNFIDDLTVCEAGAIGYKGTQELVESGDVHVKGATTQNAFSIPLNYTGSGIEFKANCKGTVKVEYNAIITRGYTVRFKVIVDGVEKEDATIKEKLSGELVLAENLPEGEHTFKFVRATENIGQIMVTAISLDGEYLESHSENLYNFDFYGDSNTAGYGTTYFKGDSDWTNYEDGTKAYAYLTAEALNANANIFAYSGMGVAVGGGTGGTGDTMLDKYPTLPKNKNADLVVIFLGSNDVNKYEDLGLTKDDVISKYNDFIQKVRTDYTNAKIVMLSYRPQVDEILVPAINQAKEAGVTDIYMLNNIPRGSSGGVSHPNIAEQAVMAEFVTEYLRNLIIDVDFKGNSIRSTGNQGLRYKFNFNNDFIENGYKGYTVKKIGALAIRTDYLGDKALVNDGEYSYNEEPKNAVKGVFYSKDNDINMLDENGVATVRLINIGYNKTAKTVDFNAYNYNYSVRTYIVLENGEEEITLYGSTSVASVFAVMKAIIDEYNASGMPTEGTLFDDYTAVQDFLNSEKTDINGKTISQYYASFN